MKWIIEEMRNTASLKNESRYNAESMIMNDKNLDSRVYVLESKQEEYDRRQREQETRQHAQELLMQEISNNTAVMNNTLKMLTDQVLPKVTQMEEQVIKNTFITQVAAWVAGALMTGAIAAFFAIFS